MEITFYVAGLIAILATLCVITQTNPVHALLYLITSLLALSAVFFALGAYFAGALEIIVYAGAIMVLFVFVVMMLNLGRAVVDQERKWLSPSVWMGPGLLSAVLLGVMIYGISSLKDNGIAGEVVTAKQVGISLFGPYVLVVELASFLLLAGLVVAYHIGRDEKVGGDIVSQRNTEEKA
ncbi:NADH-quinone oxidoreductase subunit J [Morganella morganii]|uniref:NADH-quinone oxidoreductase subunit J n=1 Tax=Morganella morganii TaxID=582 RepID=UPI00280FAA7B|nr:NADH-quinone oxidoreductase subunit J [Morganella morganii subsp. morganii]